MAERNVHNNRLKLFREARRWSQAELAQRAGISRTGVSAIEGNRLVPSVATALALARSLQCSVEELFGGEESPARRSVQWAWEPAALPARYWAAEVAGKEWLYPAESNVLATQRHDGLLGEASRLGQASATAERTLVVACCDPAIRWLALEYEQQSGFRMVALVRSSSEAVELLERGIVHAAGVHWAASRDRWGNAGVLKARGLAMDLELLHVANWEEGLAVRQDAGIRQARQAAKSRWRWIGRAPGTGARQCQDEVLNERKPPTRVAQDHRGVVEAIQNGWADVGVCVRLASEEGRLGFLAVRQESYDLCYPASLSSDPRLVALRNVVQSSPYRSMLMDLPGYDAKRCGEVQVVKANT